MLTDEQLAQMRQDHDRLVNTVSLKEKVMAALDCAGHLGACLVEIDRLKAEVERYKETIAILEDPQALDSLKRGLEDLRAGRVVDHKDP